MRETLKQWQPWALAVLLAVVPLSFSIGQRVKVLAPAVLFLIGLGAIVGSRRVRRGYAASWPVVTAMLLMVAFTIFNVLLHGLGWRPLDRPGHILLYLVIAAAFSLPLRTRVVWSGFSLTAIGLGTVCIVQHHVLGIDRAFGLNGGASASIELATVLLGFSLMALVQLLGARAGTAEKVLHLGAMAFGMYGALLTQSRGPLLAFVPVFALLLLLHARRTGRWRLSLGVGAGVVACALLAMLVLHEDMMTRFEAIGPEVTMFDRAGGGHGAIRERLEMWQTAGRALTEHPLAGIGFNQFDRYILSEIAAGRSSQAIAAYNQSHNEYLEVAAAGGIPGLLVLLLMFVMPLYYFARHVLDADEAVMVPACVGMSVVGLYMLCALTDSVFYRVMPQSFYFFLVPGMAILVARRLLWRGESR